MKRIVIAAMVVAALGTLAAVPFANAQLFTYGATTTVSSSVVSASTTTSTIMIATTTATSSTSSTSSSSSPLPIIPTVTPVVVAQPTPLTAGFIQFNGLVVSSTNSLVFPATISVSTTSAVTCEMFATKDSITGMVITCPAQPIQIDVTTATQLLLSDRTETTLANITPGDTINAFGYYDGIGTLDADVVRDASKPAVAIGGGNGGTVINIADIQTEIAQIQTLLAQLITQINALSASSVAATTTGASAPMIPYIPSSTATTTASSTSM